MRSVRALSSVSNSRFHRLFSKVMIALCLSLVYLKNSLATQVATISTDPERLMEYCSPKGKDMPHDAPVQVGIVERADPSVCEKHGNFLAENYDFENRRRRQLISKKYHENGSFYIFKPDILLKNNNRLGGKIGYYVMESFKSFQIDEYDDIKLCETIMNGYRINE